MVAGAHSCSCPSCGITCEGRFATCSQVWARGPQPVNLGRNGRTDVTGARESDQTPEGIYASDGGPQSGSNGELAVTDLVELAAELDEEQRSPPRQLGLLKTSQAALGQAQLMALDVLARFTTAAIHVGEVRNILQRLKNRADIARLAAATGPASIADELAKLRELATSELDGSAESTASEFCLAVCQIADMADTADDDVLAAAAEEIRRFPESRAFISVTFAAGRGHLKLPAASTTDARIASITGGVAAIVTAMMPPVVKELASSSSAPEVDTAQHRAGAIGSGIRAALDCGVGDDRSDTAIHQIATEPRRCSETCRQCACSLISPLEQAAPAVVTFHSSRRTTSIRARRSKSRRPWCIITGTLYKTDRTSLK